MVPERDLERQKTGEIGHIKRCKLPKKNLWSSTRQRKSPGGKKVRGPVGKTKGINKTRAKLEITQKRQGPKNPGFPRKFARVSWGARTSCKTSRKWKGKERGGIQGGERGGRREGCEEGIETVAGGKGEGGRRGVRGGRERRED